MDVPVLIFVVCLLAAIGTLKLMGSARAVRQQEQSARGSSWAITLATPALLVPTVFAALCAWLAVEESWGQLRVTEHPSWMRGIRGVHPENLIVLLVMSLLVAGFVGLLPALHREGIKPGGAHFGQGIKDHWLTFLLAKLAISLFVTGIDMLEFEGSFSAIVYVASALVLAPLLGTASLHPRRPIAAIHAAFDRCTWDMRATARLLFVQILILVLIWHVFLGAPRELQRVHILAREASVLSFNPFPLLSYSDAGAYGWVGRALLVAASMFTSTVFMLSHYRRVRKVPLRADLKNHAA